MEFMYTLTQYLQGEEFNITEFNAVLTLEPINFSKSSGTYANIERNLYRTFYENISRYELHLTIELPDGSRAYLYLLKR